MLINVEELDDEIFIDIFLSQKEMSHLNEFEMLTFEKRIDGRDIHLGICAPLNTQELERIQEELDDEDAKRKSKSTEED